MALVWIVVLWRERGFEVVGQVVRTTPNVPTELTAGVVEAGEKFVGLITSYWK